MMKKKEKYSLRYMKENDLPVVLKWRNSKRVRHNMFHDQELSMKEHVQWFSNLDDTRNHFMIFELDQNPVGVVSFHLEHFNDPLQMRVDQKAQENRIWYWGIYLGDNGSPKGTATMMGIYGLNFAFKELYVRKVCAQVLAFNERSIRFHEKIGFKKEARLTCHHLKNNRYEDVLCFALFQSEWRVPAL